MYVLGVTGGIGAGKSTVAARLATRGARVLDADQIVAALYEGGDLPALIERRFGAGVRSPDGSVDRAARAAAVFRDPAARLDLEQIVHPAVRQEVESRLAAWRQEGFGGIAIVDAALLVESEYEYPLDALLVVTAREDVRLARLQARGVTQEEARRRMAAQASEEERRARADFVVSNDGTLDDLDRELDGILTKLGRDDAS
jgi:dephospho-CoA kinase